MSDKLTSLYCENEDCRVVLFNDSIREPSEVVTDDDGEVVEETPGAIVSGGTAQQNCPGCGQFGRAKGK